MEAFVIKNNGGLYLSRVIGPNGECPYFDNIGNAEIYSSKKDADYHINRYHYENCKPVKVRIEEVENG